MLSVTARPDWLEKPVSYPIALGMTLADIVRAAPGIPEYVFQFCTIAVNGEPIDREWWPYVRPRAGTFACPVVITIHPPTLHGPGGGGGGQGKQIALIVAAIAITAGTAFIGAGGLAMLGASAGLFGAGGTLTAYAAAAFGIAGQLALTALAPPPVAANQKNRKQEADRLAGIASNTAEPFGLLPKLNGAMTFSPPAVSRPWSELVNGVVTAYGIFGCAGYNQIHEVLINGVSASEFDNIEIETREGGHVSLSGVMQDDPLTLITRCGIDQGGVVLSEFDVELKDGNMTRLVNQSDPDESAPKWHSFQTVGAVDEAVIRLLFPSGAYMVNATDDNKQERVGMPFVLQLKSAASSTWINGPEFHIAPLKKFPKLLRQRVRFVWQTAPGGISADLSADDYNTNIAYGYTGSSSIKWNADTYFRQTGTLKPAKNVAIDADGLIIYLDPATFPAGKYDIRVKRGILYRHSQFDKNAHEVNGSSINANFFGYVLAGGNYDVKIDQQEKTGAVQVEAFTCIRDEHPIPNGANLCLIAIKARYERVESVSLRATSRAPIWNGTAWGTSYEPTANPAALYRDVLLGPMNARPLAASLVDDENLAETFEDCVTNGYVANGLLQGTSVEQALQTIAATAFGVPQQEEKWSILRERNTSLQTPFQILTPRIIRNVTIDSEFAALPHALRCEFLDETNDYKANEIIVYRPPYDVNTATLFQAIKYDHFTSPALVTSRGTFDVRQMVYRKRRYSGDMDWIHLVSPRGTLVGLLIEELETAMTSALISAVITSGANITGLLLDAKVTSPPTGAGCTIQLATGGTVTKQIAAVTNSQTITFTTPFTDPAQTVEAGKAAVVGAFSSTMRRVKVFDIERRGNLEARVTLLDEAPEIYA